MALVGEAHIVVRALTNRVNDDIRRGFNGASATGRRAGESLGESFAQGFKSKANGNIFENISNGLKSMVPDAEAAREAYRTLSAAGYALGPAISTGVSGISALIGALGALIGSAGTAAGGLAAVGNAAVALKGGLGVAKLALGGVGAAISKSQKVSTGAAARSVADAKARAAAAQAVQDAEKALARTIQQNRDRMVTANKSVEKAQKDLNDAIEEGRQQLKDLAFQAEGAALDEKSAALALTKARQDLAASQDLPPNSQARQQAQLAYDQADLAYREAKASAADYAKQQDQASKTGVAGTKAYQNAAQGLADAQADQAKTARDNAQSQADAEDRVLKAKKAQKDADAKTPSAGGGGGADPFAGLNKYQKEFAQFIISLKPKLDELKLAASEAFLPPLQKAITTLVDRAFPTVKTGVTQIATAMGAASIQVANTITTSKNLSNLSKLFTSSSDLIRTFGKIIGNVFGILLSVLNASAPLAQHLADAIASATKKLDVFFKSKPGKDGLTTYFANAQLTLSKFGQIFGNIFKGIGGIIKASFGADSPANQMLDFFIDGTKGFASLNDASKQPGLRKYFQDVVDNSKPLLSLLAGIVRILGRMGAQPEVGQTFTILKSALPDIQSLGDKLNAAGPSLARLVVQFVKLFNALQDSGALKIFLDTLGQIVGVIGAFVTSPFGSTILTLVGRFFAFSLAFTTAGKAAGFFAKVVVGDVQHGMAVIGKIGSGVTGIRDVGRAFTGITKNGAGLRQAFAQLTYSNSAFARSIGTLGPKLIPAAAGLRTFGRAFSNALGPVGKIILIVGLVVGVLVTLYNTSDTFRNTVNKAFASVLSVVGPVLDSLMKAVQPLIPVLQDAGKQIATAFAPILPILANAAGQIVQAFAPLATMLLTTLVPAIAQIATAIVPVIALLLGALVPALAAILSAILPVVTTILSALVPILAILIKAIVPVITTIITLLVPVIQVLANIIVFVAQVIANVLIAVLGGLPGVFAFVGGAIGVLGDIFGNIFTFIVQAVQNGVNFVVGIVRFLVAVWTLEFNFIRDVITNVFNFIVGAVTLYINTVRNIITTVIRVVVTVWNAVWGGIRDFFVTIFRAIVTYVTNYINTVRTIITTVINAVNTVWNRIWGGIRDFFHGIWDGIVGAVRNFQTIFHNVFNGIVGFVRTAFSGVLGAVRTPINGIIGLVNGAIRALNKLQVKVPKGVPLIGGTTFGLNIPTIPTLAKGGIVSPSPGGSIVNVAEAGRPESITPLDSNGLSAGDKAVLDALKNNQGTSVTINLHPPQGASNAEIAAMVNQEITFRMRKGAVA